MVSSRVFACVVTFLTDCLYFDVIMSVIISFVVCFGVVITMYFDVIIIYVVCFGVVITMFFGVVIYWTPLTDCPLFLCDNFPMTFVLSFIWCGHYSVFRRGQSF